MISHCRETTMQHHTMCTEGMLTVGFLVSGAGTWTAELLGLAATWVGDQQTPVVLD